MNAGSIQRGEPSGIAEEKNDILGALLREQRRGQDEESKSPGKHHSIVTGIRTAEWSGVRGSNPSKSAWKNAPRLKIDEIGVNRVRMAHRRARNFELAQPDAEARRLA
jgi:hypothetical protein